MSQEKLHEEAMLRRSISSCVEKQQSQDDACLLTNSPEQKSSQQTFEERMDDDIFQCKLVDISDTFQMADESELSLFHFRTNDCAPDGWIKEFNKFAQIVQGETSVNKDAVSIICAPAELESCFESLTLVIDQTNNAYRKKIETPEYLLRMKKKAIARRAISAVRLKLKST